MADLWDNPAGTDGFEFIEYAAPEPKAMGALFERLGGEDAGAASLDPAGHGLAYIDHLTHNVHKGRMKEWATKASAKATSRRCSNPSNSTRCAAAF